MTKTVRTRIAPSPTGYPHIGTVYQVLFDYVYAHKHGGQFVVRIEDTDRSRFVAGAEDVVYGMLSWFGLEGDEDPVKGGNFGPYRQSERLPIYRKYVDALVEKGCAYYCFCTKERLDAMRKDQEARKMPPMYDRHCRNLSASDVADKRAAGVESVVRMKVPDGETIVLQDLLVGEIEFRSDLLDDQVLLKADGFPTYHMAVVVDDHLMEITHIFRGREWIPSTPKHVLLYRFFGWEIPEYIHLPLILNSEGQGKLSKRHGHSSVDYYRTRGYLPEAVLNYLSNIVWNHPEGKEIYAIDEFTRLFEIQSVTSQGARFDLKKLDWVNGQWIRSMQDSALAARIVGYSTHSYDDILRVLPLVKDRVGVLSDFDPLALFFFTDGVIPVVREDMLKKDSTSVASDSEIRSHFKQMLLGKVQDVELVQKMLKRALDEFSVTSSWEHRILEELMRGVVGAENWKAGDFFMSLRVAVTGRTATPPLFESMELIGKDECLRRITFALSFF
jgi:glutamyl-tRNA synthetase